MARSRYGIFENNSPYFLTATVVAWLPVFAYPRFVDIIFDSWRFIQKQRCISIYGYVVMENHLHWIAKGEGLIKQVMYFKSYTARKIIDELNKAGYETLLAELKYFKQRHKVGQYFQLWQEGNHPVEIQNENIMKQKLDYIHQNPVRRGYVDDPVHWRYSSAANYEGLRGFIKVETDWS